MNNIENDSTFFITIEKNNIKDHIQKFKNTKSLYFSKSEKSLKNDQTINHSSSIPSPNNEISRSQSNIDQSVSSQINQTNNITKINTNQNYRPNKSFIATIKKKNQNKNKIDKFEGNIDFDDIDDIDEYNDIKFSINVNKPKLPFNNKSYYNENYNISKKNSHSASNNILKNIMINSYKIKSQIIKKNNNHNKVRNFKNKSCSFENNGLIKLKFNQNISILNSKIEMLKTLNKRRNLEILSFQLFFEKTNIHRRIKRNIQYYDKIVADIKKKIFKLKAIKSKYDEKYIKKNISDEEIYKENLIYATKKVEIIEKILNYKTILINYKKNEIDNNNNSNKIYIEESTINNESNFFENDLNILETKENLNLREKNNIKLTNKNIINGNDQDDLSKLNNINSIKNKNELKYNVPGFLIETKTHIKNKYQNRYNPNSKFNIYINSNFINRK